MGYWLLFLSHCFLLVIFPSCTCSMMPLCNHDEASALLQFKSSLNTSSSSIFFRGCPMHSLSYPNTKSWKNGTNCCLWDGVSCDTKSGHVIGLDLSCGFLQGKLNPNSTLFHLTHVQKLNLAFNDFSNSQLSSRFGDLVALTHLNLSFSGFEGVISSKISCLSKLISLDLSTSDYLLSLFPSQTMKFMQSTLEKFVANTTSLKEIAFHNIDMSSIKPSSLSLFSNFSSSLISLRLSATGLKGKLSDNILNLPNLQMLDLSSNINLEGEFPNFNWSTPLKYLDLSNTSFSGKVSNSISHLKSLNYLDFHNAHFEGNVLLLLSNLTRLEYLDISNNKFKSEIPLSLSNLKNLTYIDLSYNNFQGPVPLCLENITGRTYLDLAYLDLSNNKIDGKIPNWFNTGDGTLSYLDLSHNLLTSAGHLSSSLSDIELEYIDLSFNMLEGEIPIPPFANIFFSMSNNKLSGNLSSRICNASFLEMLNLSHNNLTGELPECIGTFQSLAVMDLKGNNLVGTIPKTYFDLQFLETMNFNGNQLNGSLPLGMAKCKQVQVLDLGENNIEGSFPSWLESLPELQVLVLRGNRFNGTITNMKVNSTFPKLRVFDVSNNNFSGTLPTTYIKNFKGMVMNVNNGLQYMNKYIYNAYTYNDSLIVTIKGLNYELKRILTTFTTLDLSNNKFEGHIPTIIGELKSLKGLNLSYNKIIGSIPQSFGDLENLEWLDLSSNKLTGEIPATLTNLYSLSVLNLSQNHLEGIIPRGNQFNTFQNDSYKGNSGLCGLPLSKQCHRDEDEPIDSTPVQDEQEFLFDWKVVAIGYASGVIIGILLGCIMFLIEKPQWVIKFVQDIGNQIVKKRRNHKFRTNRRG